MVELTVLPDGVRIATCDGETVLAALGRAGLKYRVGCRRGGCGICKVHLVLGEVGYEKSIADSVLGDGEKVDGICLSCRAVPLTNIVIELQEGDKLRRVLPYGFASAAATRSGSSSHQQVAENGRKETSDECHPARVCAHPCDRSRGSSQPLHQHHRHARGA